MRPGKQRALSFVCAMTWLVAAPAHAQVPARYYWDTLSGASAVPLIFNSVSGNTNPFDESHTVTPGANFDATVAMTGFAHMFDVWDRSAMAALIVPMGRISGDVTVAGRTANQSASGFGDPMLELNLNVVGPKAQKNIPDVLRYRPGLSVDLLADIAFPVGEYDSSQSLNIGQNRWYGRVGFPTIMQFGRWVPGQRTTVELLPAVWMFSNNSNYVGQTLETDPLFQLDAHVTRDLTERLWGSIDGAWYNGGRSTIAGVKGEKLNNVGAGITLGYSVDDNINLTVGYKSTLNDDASTDLKMDAFMVTLVFGWHPLLEGSKRLKSATSQ